MISLFAQELHDRRLPICCGHSLLPCAVLPLSMDSFSDPQAIARYAENPPRMVPGYADMQRMAGLLLAENAPDDAQMLDLARRTLVELAVRAQLHEGLIDSAPEGPFDGATCILTLHFIERQERLRTLREVRRRLKPGAPFVTAHFSIPRGEVDLWMSRYAAFAISSGIERAQAEAARFGIAERLPILSPQEDEQLLREAGFTGISLFYVGFAFRGWVAYA